MTTECRLGAADETIADPETPVRVPAESLDACQAELADVKDRLLRALADQENSRRRAEREREDAVRFAAAQLVTDCCRRLTVCLVRSKTRLRGTIHYKAKVCSPGLPRPSGLYGMFL